MNRTMKSAFIALTLTLLFGAATADSENIIPLGGVDCTFSTDGLDTTLDCNQCPTGGIVIPELGGGLSITTIAPFAFEGCTGLTSVTFPATLTAIGMSAFYGCTGLTSVTFPEGLTTIGNWAFLGCTGLTSLTFPATLTTIKQYAFNDVDSTVVIYNGDNKPETEIERLPYCNQPYCLEIVGGVKPNHVLLLLQSLQSC